MASPLKDLVKSLERQGVTIANGTRHAKIMHGGKVIGVLPRDLNTNDKTALCRTMSQLRRAGVKV